MSSDFRSFFKANDPGIQFEEQEPVMPEEEVKLLEGEELDSLAGEIGIKRNEGESDIDLRERMALETVGTDTVKCLEATFAKPREKWHPDEEMMVEVFNQAPADKKEAFIKSFLHREEVSDENKTLAAQHNVMFPRVCVLRNDLREVMSWFLGTVAPWDRDPCWGCTYCLLGKNPQEVSLEDCMPSDQADTSEE